MGPEPHLPRLPRLAPAAPAAPAAAACMHSMRSMHTPALWGPYPAGRWPPPIAQGRYTRSHPLGPHRCRLLHMGWRHTHQCLQRDGRRRGTWVVWEGGAPQWGRGHVPGASGHSSPGLTTAPHPHPADPSGWSCPIHLNGCSPSAQVGPLQPDGQWHSKPEGTSWQEPPLAHGLEAQACSAVLGTRGSGWVDGVAWGPQLSTSAPPHTHRAPRLGQSSGAPENQHGAPWRALTYPAHSSCPSSQQGRRSGTGQVRR